MPQERHEEKMRFRKKRQKKFIDIDEGHWIHETPETPRLTDVIISRKCDECGIYLFVEIKGVFGHVTAIDVCSAFTVKCICGYDQWIPHAQIETKECIRNIKKKRN